METLCVIWRTKSARPPLTKTATDDTRRPRVEDLIQVPDVDLDVDVKDREGQLKVGKRAEGGGTERLLRAEGKDAAVVLDGKVWKEGRRNRESLEVRFRDLRPRTR